MNGQYYAYLLNQAREAILQKRCGTLARGVMFLQDNALVDTPRVARNALKLTGFTDINHPPYSPGMAPSNFLLFFQILKRSYGNEEF